MKGPPFHVEFRGLRVASQHFEKIAFAASNAPEAQDALHRLETRYGRHDIADADVVVALGGDGLMLQVLHRVMNTGIPIYGMNRGSVGFLMNAYHEESLRERLHSAVKTTKKAGWPRTIAG